MCIIIWAPQGSIPSDHLLDAMLINQDGWGFAVPTKRGIHTFKTIDHEKLFDAWARRPAGPVLFHARWATHGAVKDDNCHPFRIPGKRLVVAHNGIIPGYGSKTKSDTLDFVEKVLVKLPDWFTEEERVIKAMGKAIGYSKLVFLDKNGMATIVNEHLGVWKDNRWYSNTQIFGK